MIFSAEEFEQRIVRLTSVLRQKSIDAVILNQSADLYYYTGSVLPLYCVISSTGDAFVLARKSSARIKDEVPQMKFEFFNGSKDLQKIWNAHSLNDVKSLGFNLDATSYSVVGRIVQLSTHAEAVDLSWDLRALRMVKSDGEIKIHERAGKIVEQLTDVIRDKFIPGMTELEMSAHIEHFFRVNGNGIVKSNQEGLVISSGVCSAGLNTFAGNKFDGICSGAGISPALPFGASFCVIPPRTPILFDYGFVLDGYHVDITRMASHGEPEPAVLDAYRAMQQIEKACVAALIPGATWESVYQVAFTMSEKLGFADEFMGLGTEKVRFVGHGVGIQLDEPPFFAPKMSHLIQENMVVAIEPKVSLPGIGVVGVENTYVIRKYGASLITSTSDEFVIL
jgi:Xaa-Pro dipeptidase